MEASTEQVFFADSAVRITATEAVFGQRRYALADIRSVSVVFNPADKTTGWRVTGGILVMLLVLWLIAATMNLTNDLLDLRIGGVVYTVLTLAPATCMVASLVVSYALTTFWPVRYLVVVSGRFGEATVVLARHYRYARKVEQALKKGIKAAKEIEL
jgi:hypothetical protein